MKRLRMLSKCQGIFVRALVAVLLHLVAVTVTPSFAEPSSHYVRQTKTSNAVIIFVHGIFGDGNSTWTNGNAYWPSMLSEDPAFSSADIFVYTYPTKWWSNLSIDELAENMRSQLKANGVPDHRRVVFLVHSMGGLVTRAYLLKNRDVAARTSFIYFFATPTTGSELASLASIISRSPQLQGLKVMDAKDYLADLIRNWLNARLKIPSYCAYEKVQTAGTIVVSAQSAFALCTEPVDPVNANHIDIVKPQNQESDAYISFKNAYRREMQPLTIEFRRNSAKWTYVDSTKVTFTPIGRVPADETGTVEVRGLWSPRPGYPCLGVEGVKILIEGESKPRVILPYRSPITVEGPARISAAVAEAVEGGLSADNGPCPGTQDQLRATVY